MTCEEIREELAAYHDGELVAEDCTRIATHLKSCTACSHEEAQLVRLSHLLAKMERVAPSPDFAATFWQRLEQESYVSPLQESKLTRWWREWRESVSGWRVMPTLAGAASLVVFLGYIFSERFPLPSSLDESPQTQDVAKITLPASEETRASSSADNLPSQVQDYLELFANYRIITDFERLAHFDEIVATVISEEPLVNIAESDLPQELLEESEFFANYPILQKLEEMKNLETVLGIQEDSEATGQG
jgi:hypothetical protein